MGAQKIHPRNGQDAKIPHKFSKSWGTYTISERFIRDKEDFIMAPVWILLYSLLEEFWLDKILMGIGNIVGQYVKTLEATK